MHIKFISASKIKGGNKGSCKSYVKYLEKENEGLSESQQEYFFSHEKDYVDKSKVIHDVDGNWRGLKEEEIKFYSIVISPSRKELEHVDNDSRKLKAYTRAVMDEYAKNFNREIDGMPLTANDLVYHAKIERSRSYDDPKDDKKHANDIRHNLKVQAKLKEVARDEKLSNYEKSVKVSKLRDEYIKDSAGTVKLPGNPKPGSNLHIHVIIAKKDKSQRISLSPSTNSKGTEYERNGKTVKVGFERKEFQMNSEKRFDQMFSYDRSVSESMEFKVERSKGNEAKYAGKLIDVVKNPERAAQELVVNAILADPKLKATVFGMRKAARGIEDIPSMAMRYSVTQVAKSVTGMLIQGTNPAAAVVKNLLTKAITSTLSAGL